MQFEFSLSALRKGIIMLVVPFLELAGLRLFLHYVWGLRFGFANTTDYDYLIPAPLAFLLLVQVLEKGESLTLSLRRKTLVANLTLVLAFLWFNTQYHTLAIHQPTLATAFWFLLLGGITFTGLCVWVSPRVLVLNPNRIAVLPCSLIASSLYIYMNGFRGFWNVLGNATARVIHFLFTNIPMANVRAIFTPEDAVRIDHPLMSVRIGIGCGGGDAFFYFTLVFLLIALVCYPSVKLRGWIANYIGGVVLMFGLNIFRIILLFYSGIALRAMFGLELGTDLFKLLFHTHLGWLIYSVGIIAYFRYWNYLLSRGLFTREPPSSQGMKRFEQTLQN